MFSTSLMRMVNHHYTYMYIANPSLSKMCPQVLALLLACFIYLQANQCIPCTFDHICRGGVGGPAGPAKAGPLLSGSFVSSSDCRDSLRTTPKLALCSRFSLSFPLLCRRIRSPARPDRTASAPTHFDSTNSFYYRTLPVVDPPCTFTSIFYLQWPDYF